MRVSLLITGTCLFKFCRSVISVISAGYMYQVSLYFLEWLSIGFLPYNYEALLTCFVFKEYRVL